MGLYSIEESYKKLKTYFQNGKTSTQKVQNLKKKK